MKAAKPNKKNPTLSTMYPIISSFYIFFCFESRVIIIERGNTTISKIETKDPIKLTNLCRLFLMKIVNIVMIIKNIKLVQTLEFISFCFWIRFLFGKISSVSNENYLQNVLFKDFLLSSLLIEFMPISKEVLKLS